MKKNRRITAARVHIHNNDRPLKRPVLKTYNIDTGRDRYANI